VIKPKDIREVLRCIKACKEGSSGGQYRIGSLFLYKNIRIGPFLNNYFKTDPLIPTIANYKYQQDILITLHAEVKVIKELNKRRLSTTIIKKGTLYISGLSPTDIVLTSKPCINCMKLITRTSIHRLIYTASNSEGLLIKENIIN
jgi:tRNA(Arg) A34 adenosine deaminase TadA